MQKESKKPNVKAIVFWLLSAICMGVIFWFSSRTANESTNQSNFFVEWLESLFGQNEVWVFIVRKSAHCLEFSGLCLLLNCALYYTKEKKELPIAIGITSLYAVTDEIHQIFVEGRSCELRDWVIDTFGAVIGAIGFLILFYIISAIIKRKKK